MLENAIRALVSNAARAVVRRADQGEPAYTPFVAYELKTDFHRVVLSIIDNGGGVPSQIQDRLFEPFVRGQTDGGHGLGLFYAAWVAEVFKGRLVLAESSKERTEFQLILHSAEERTSWHTWSL
jgi:two-component system nitrogen regulation sensor histidine kinase GlnL